MRRAFTLIELLVVVTIIAILAAIMFPVFAESKAAAKKTVSISNAKQLATAYQVYQLNNEDRFPLAAYNGSMDAEIDRLCHDLVRPYHKTETLLFEPVDPTPQKVRERPEPYWPEPMTEEQRQLNLSMTSNWGYNMQFFAPIYFKGDGEPDPTAIFGSQVAAPANSLLMVDSVWGRNESGTPYGGGNFAVDAPCWTDANGKDMRPGDTNRDFLFFGGWNPSKPNNWNVFGGAWPWHNMGKRVVVAYADGHVRVEPIQVLAAGCDVKDKSVGFVTDPGKFIWSSN